jgi:hypothetical protein
MAQTAPLSVLGLLGFALRDVLGNLAGLARIAWPYYALAAACAALGFAFAGDGPLGALAAMFGPGTAALVTGIAVVACTVVWQRHVVLGEPLAGIAPLNGRVLRYFLWSVVISLICAMPILAGFAATLGLGLTLPDPAGEGTFSMQPAGILVCGAAFVLGVVLILRLILILPAISVDDHAMTFARSWQVTRGHGLRMAGALLLLTAGLALFGAVMALVVAALEAAGDGSLVAPVLGLILQAVVNLVATVAAASLIARAYMLLVAPAP